VRAPLDQKVKLIAQHKQRKRALKLLDKSEWIVRGLLREICWECGQDMIVTKIELKLK